MRLAARIVIAITRRVDAIARWAYRIRRRLRHIRNPSDDADTASGRSQDTLVGRDFPSLDSSAVLPDDAPTPTWEIIEQMDREADQRLQQAERMLGARGALHGGAWPLDARRADTPGGATR